MRKSNPILVVAVAIATSACVTPDGVVSPSAEQPRKVDAPTRIVTAAGQPSGPVTKNSRPRLSGSEVSLIPTEGAPIPAVWTLHRGQRVDDQLNQWAQSAGWTFMWKAPVSWLVVADTTFTGKFEDVVVQVVEGLYAEGKPIHLVLSAHNKVAEVISYDVR